jgi:hypothetical protein
VDDAALFERADAAQTGRFRQAHTLGKRRVADAGVALQHVEDLAIDAVHAISLADSGVCFQFHAGICGFVQVKTPTTPESVCRPPLR